MSEAKKRILSMLAEGKITVEQSEELLAAISEDEQEKPKSDNKATLGVELGNLANSIHDTVREAMKKVESPSRELKARLKEFGGWMHDIVGSFAGEFAHARGEPTDGLQVDFSVPEPENFAGCTVCFVENLFGSVTINEGPQFALHVSGRISRSAMENQPPNLWFGNKALKIENDVITIGIDRKSPAKAVLDLELTLPPGMKIRGKSVSSGFTIKGAFELNDLQTVSGDVRLKDVGIKEAAIDSVSGDVKIEGGDINLQLKTTSGDLMVKSARIERLRAQSVSGDMLVTENEVLENSSVEMVSTSGDVAVEKITGPWCKIEANTRTGDIAIKWKGNMTPTQRQGLLVESNEPGANFRVETVSGDITFD